MQLQIKKVFFNPCLWPKSSSWKCSSPLFSRAKRSSDLNLRSGAAEQETARVLVPNDRTASHTGALAHTAAAQESELIIKERESVCVCATRTNTTNEERRPHRQKVVSFDGNNGGENDEYI